MGRGRKTGLSDEERQLFREATADVRPLCEEPRQLPAREQRSQGDAALRRQLAENGPSHESQPPLSDPYQDSLDEAPRQFHRGGLQSKLLRRLRTGDLPLEGSLDLHGMRVEQARAALARFIDGAQGQGQRCLLLVYGKGYGSENGRGVLRRHALHWLRQHPALLAYAPAQPRHGGDGALYLLIRRGTVE